MFEHKRSSTYWKRATPGMKPEEANHLINTAATAEFYTLKAFNFLDLNT
jgi:CRISPR/Cas system-associated protein Csm6